MNQTEVSAATDGASASLARAAILNEPSRVRGRFHAVLHDAQGNEKWVEKFDNLVTDVGAKLMLDTILAGSAFTASAYMGLKGTGTAVVGDTQSSHGAWSEVGNANAPAYGTLRKTPTWSAASGTGTGSRSKSPSAGQAFTFTSGGTVAGCFININGTSSIDNTTGTLFSAGDFGSPRTVVSTDVLTVTYTLSA